MLGLFGILEGKGGAGAVCGARLLLVKQAAFTLLGPFCVVLSHQSPPTFAVSSKAL